LRASARSKFLYRHNIRRFDHVKRYDEMWMIYL
jgi:hypothetical protein